MHKFLKLLTALTVLWSLALLVLGSDVGMGLLGMLLTAYGGMALAVLWLVAVPAVEFWRRKKGRERVCLPDFAFAPVLALVVAVLVGSGITFKLRFKASEGELTAYSESIAGTEQLEPGALGKWIGLFRVSTQQVLQGGVVRLGTADCFLDKCGLVYSPNGEPPRVGEDSYQPVAKNWWAWVESW